LINWEITKYNLFCHCRKTWHLSE